METAQEGDVKAQPPEQHGELSKSEVEEPVEPDTKQAQEEPIVEPKPKRRVRKPSNRVAIKPTPAPDQPITVDTNFGTGLLGTQQALLAESRAKKYSGFVLN